MGTFLTILVAWIITIFLCVGTWLLCYNFIPDLIGHSFDSFIGETVTTLIAVGLMIVITLIMKPFLGKKSDHSGGGNHHDAGVGGDGGGGGGCGGGD